VPMHTFVVIENATRASHGSPRMRGALCNVSDRTSGIGDEDTEVARKSQIQSITVMIVEGSGRYS
jgi:hypothetical protein